VTKDLLSRAPPCFERHVKLNSFSTNVSAALAVIRTQFQGGLTSGRRPVVKIVAESLSQHDERHVVPTPLSRIIIIISPLQSTAGHRPLQLISRHLARSSATRIQLLPAVLRKSSLYLIIITNILIVILVEDFK
jgi:hypothetical protein